MDIGTMFAMGLLNSENEDEKEGASRMTDYQFKAFIKMCLVLVETISEVKVFKKRIQPDWGDSASAYSVFASMLGKIAESTDSMEKVKQVLQDMLKD